MKVDSIPFVRSLSPNMLDENMCQRKTLILFSSQTFMSIMRLPGTAAENFSFSYVVTDCSVRRKRVSLAVSSSKKA